MGMDLISRKFREGYLHYNFSEWSDFIRYLDRWGVDTLEFSSFNDGDLIAPETCQAVADALIANWDKLTEDEQHWLRGHAYLWRRLAKLGGARQC